MCCFFFFKQKTAYEMRISDWSSDVCSSDLPLLRADQGQAHARAGDAAQAVQDVLRSDRPGYVGHDGAHEGFQALVRGGGRREIAAVHRIHDREIGRASCRERVWQYG